MIITKEQIATCFEGKSHQTDVLEELYKLVFPEWEEIEQIEGWPSCGKKLWHDVCGRFFTFDKLHHGARWENGQLKLGVLAGGAWLNSGFKCDMALADYEVTRCPVTLKARQEVAA